MSILDEELASQPRKKRRAERRPLGVRVQRLVKWFWSQIGHPNFYFIVAVVNIAIDMARAKLSGGTALIVVCCLLFQFLARICQYLETNNKLWKQLVDHIEADT